MSNIKQVVASASERVEASPNALAAVTDTLVADMRKLAKAKGLAYKMYKQSASMAVELKGEGKSVSVEGWNGSRNYGVPKVAFGVLLDDGVKIKQVMQFDVGKVRFMDYDGPITPEIVSSYKKWTQSVMDYIKKTLG